MLFLALFILYTGNLKEQKYHNLLEQNFNQFYKKISPALNIKYYKDPQKLGGKAKSIPKKLCLDHIKVKIHKSLHEDFKLNPDSKKGGGECILS